MSTITSQQLFFTIENLKIKLYMQQSLMQTIRCLKRIACQSKAKSKYFEMQLVIYEA